MLIQHRSGVKHQNADSLSRIPDTIQSFYDYRPNVPLHALPCGVCPYCTQARNMDILGPLPEAKKGNKYILVIIEQFTKWIECFPLPNQKAELVVKSLVDNIA